MKKIIFSLAVLAIAATVALNVNLSFQKSNDISALSLSNIEALASENSYPDYSQCPILQYNRGYMEEYRNEEWSGMVGASGYVTIGGIDFGPFKAYLFAKFKYKEGFCESAPNNCCIKTHVGKVKAL